MDTKHEAYTFRNMTMNCGNGVSDLSNEICKASEACDVLVIHAQELDFYEELTKIEKNLPAGYAVKRLPPQVTITKLKDYKVLSRQTGICNLMIYNTGKFKAPEVVESKFIRVSMLNKGMYVQDFHLPSISRDKPPLKFKAVSAHLDSFNQNNRLREWQRGHETLYPRVRNFKELAQAIPDCMFGGGDMNTRLKLGRDKNPWGPGDSSEETKAYNQCPLGQVQYSEEVTYNKVAYKNLVTSNKSNLTIVPTEDPEENVTQQEGKRKGEQDRGYLDVCWSCTGQESDVSPKVAETFAFTGANQRDHAAVLSAVQEFRPYKTDLARVEAHVLTHMQLFDQGQASDPEKGVFNQLKQALSAASAADKKELLVSYYNRYVVELPKQIFDAHRISDLKTRIEALELITQSRILADVYLKNPLIFQMLNKSSVQ